MFKFYRIPQKLSSFKNEIFINNFNSGFNFYGNVLGIFLLAFFVKFVRSKAVFIAALITQVIIIYFWYIDLMPYLWLNLVGCAIVMGIAILLQILLPKKNDFEIAISKN